MDPATLVFGDELIEQNYQSPDFSRSGFEGIYFYSPERPDNSFFQTYKDKYETNPVFGAGPAYDTVFMIAEVLKDKPEDIDKYMHSRSFKTVSFGDVTFDEIGGVVAKDSYFTVKQVVNGEAKDVLR